MYGVCTGPTGREGVFWGGGFSIHRQRCFAIVARKCINRQIARLSETHVSWLLQFSVWKLLFVNKRYYRHGRFFFRWQGHRCNVQTGYCLERRSIPNSYTSSSWRYSTACISASSYQILQIIYFSHRRNVLNSNTYFSWLTGSCDDGSYRFSPDIRRRDADALW